MRVLGAKEAKETFGAMLDGVQHEPVTIARNGRPMAVMLSMQDYERLETVENAWWAEQADKAAKEGFIGIDEGEKLLKELLNVKN